MKNIIKVMLNGSEVDFDVCVNMMDDEIREDIHAEYAGEITEQQFIDLYCERHAEKYDGEQFQV